MRRLGLVALALCVVSTACGHARTVEAPAATAPRAQRPREQPFAGGTMKTDEGMTLATSPAGLLQPGAAEKLQARLARAGMLGQGEQTGDLDAATRAALERFQKKHDLPATGEPDDATVRVLGLAPDEIFRSGPRSSK